MKKGEWRHGYMTKLRLRNCKSYRKRSLDKILLTWLKDKHDIVKKRINILQHYLLNGKKITELHV